MPVRANKAALEEVEEEGSTRPPWMLTFTEVKLLGIAGVRDFVAECKPRIDSEHLPGWLLSRW
jgi:hypothetical protein